MREITLIVVGPLEIPYDRQTRGLGKRIDRNHASEFWEQEDATLVAPKQGCYVFGLRAGKGITPWYVGRTSRSLKKECFHYHKLAHYNKVLFRGVKGRPVMFFVVPEGGRKTVSAKTLKDMEKSLIQTALFKNPRIANTKNTKNIPHWGIAGVVRSGKGKSSATSRKFKSMMGL